MSTIIKCRSPSGVFTLNFDSNISVREFRKILHEKTGIEPDYQISKNYIISFLYIMIIE